MEFTFATAVASIAAVVLWVGSYSSWNPRRRCDEVLVVHLLPGCVSSRVQYQIPVYIGTPNTIGA